MDAGKVLEKMLPGITPSAQEKKDVQAAIDKFTQALKKRLKHARIVVGGSFAKGTWLRGVHDIDLFVCFNYKRYKDRSNEISDALQAALNKAGIKHKRLHGSRDYFEASRGKCSFELIPILDIKKASQAKNITDVSPLHAKWVSRKINERLADQVRLLKAFCAAQGYYGAETHIKGFSGYVCEILTAKYGSFIAVLRAAEKWKDKEEIDVEKHYKGRNLIAELNTSKTQSPLIIIDPVQPDRNAAAALSSDSFGKFIKAAKQFLKKPTPEFFAEKHTTLEDLKRKAKGKELITITATPLKGKRDVVCTKILKIAECIKKQLAENGFKVLSSGTEWNGNSLIWIMTDGKKPDSYKVIAGPPLSATEHVKRFRKKHRNTFTKGKKAYAKAKRQHTDAAELVRSLIRNDQYIKERAEKISVND